MKFIDLHDEIEDNLGSTRAPIERILEYLDDHPELTGRDRMESELKAISDRTQVSPWAVRAVTTALGHGVIPDPKPTSKREARKEVIMAGKYESLYEPMINDETFDLTTAERLGALVAMQWLDSHPDQVPGRELTESEMGRKCDLYGDSYLTGFTSAGGRVVPDPEPEPKPTNAERWETFIRESDFRVSGFFGSDATKALSRVLDECGVKAPGGQR